MKLLRLLCMFFLALFFAQILQKDVFAAVNPVKIFSGDTTVVDLSPATEIHLGEGKHFQISTAPGADGIVRRIEVQANNEYSNGHWAVFTIVNSSSEQMDRLIVAPHYRLGHSGIFSPDLGSVRIHSITPSEGFSLDRQASTGSDIFSLTINPGAVVTFVAELGSSILPQLYLWDPDTYRDTVNSYTLYYGILLGIAGLLALLLTILFVVKGTYLFPISAIFAWSVLIYLCIDFCFFNRIFAITSASDCLPLWRAMTEVSISTALLTFLFSYLNLNLWHCHFVSGVFLWFLMLLSLCALTFFDPIHTAGIARISLGLTAILGLILISFFSFHGYDRAIMLIPIWLLVIFWVAGAGTAMIGFIDNDIVQPALASGLVLIVLLISFTVAQHALSGSNINEGLFSDAERQALAVMGTDHIIWDWDVLRDRVCTNPALSLYPGSSAKPLSSSLRNWLPSIHIEDRNRFRLALDTLIENRRNKIMETFRLRASDGQYRWFSLHARPVGNSDGEIIRCIGMMMDATQRKKTEEHLFHNSIYDSLTGLPNKQLFLDRLQTYCNLAMEGRKIFPVLLVIDFDDFRSVNQHYGMSIGDAFLLTVTRRLSRYLKPLDTLCRLSADRFAFLLVSQNNLERIASFTLSLQKTLALPVPVTFPKREIKISTSIGILPWTGENIRAEDRLSDATLAMYHAKYQGGDRVEPFQPFLRAPMQKKSFMEDRLLQALANKELEVVYSPVFDISDGTIIGLEARLRWDHPAHAPRFLPDFVHAAENANVIIQIISYIISRALADTAFINEHFPQKEFFMSIDIPSSHFIRHELLNSFRTALMRTPLREGQLHVATSQSIIMQNPELAFLLFQRFKGIGVGLILNNFGAEYSFLDCLFRFPLTMIKLDHTIPQGLIPNQELILKSLITMAHDLNFKVIAGGVENDDAARFLKEARCDYLQSRAFCNPIPFKGIVSIFKKCQARK